jgi:phosphate acetyltransferase
MTAVPTVVATAHPYYDRLIEAGRANGPVTVAVAHPCDRYALEAALDAAPMSRPAARIHAAADAAGLDIGALRLVDTAHSHASAARAVELVREGKAAALMKGSLHTDELMGAVVAATTGLRTARRLSHCFVMDVPGRSEPLIITDAAINIIPTLAEKRDIVQNAIDLAHVLRFEGVRVAILAAVETVSDKMPSTIDAAALCKMADRGQITGAILDGPLAMDNAIDPQAAAVKGLDSPVAGRANVLVAPDLEAGNMLAKSLTFMAGAAAAGIVLGARVPLILTSRADSVAARLASCAVAVLLARHQLATATASANASVAGR